MLRAEACPAAVAVDHVVVSFVAVAESNSILMGQRIKAEDRE